MSYRYNNAFVKPGLNTLVAPTPSYTYGLWSWGLNGNGQLGLSNTTNYSSPKQVGALTDWLTVSCGNYSTYGIKSNGTLWSWGANQSGALGLGNTTYYSSPKQVGLLTNWEIISASKGGEFYAVAIKADGTLWSWGKNVYGSLGLGNTTYYSSPKQVGSLTNWSNVYCGNGHTVAIKTDGTLWAWGYNQQGQLGLGDSGPGTNRSSPTQVGSLTTWVTAVAGMLSVIAIKTDGTLWSWGYNASGQLGLGNTTNYSSPKQVGSLTTWQDVSCGFHALAIKTNGTLWSWGYNQFGQLGLGNATNYSSPKQVGALIAWSRISCGEYTSGAVQTNHTLWMWGRNNYGQLGLGDSGTYTERSSPTQVGSLTSWYSVSSTRNDTIALQV